MLSFPINLWLTNVLGEEYTLLPIVGRANSKIVKVISKSADFALKIYPDKEYDKRDRLGVEFDALTILRASNVQNITVPVKKNSTLNVALYEWIEGENFNVVGTREVRDAINFIKKLYELSNNDNQFCGQMASEACLSIGELINQISNRFDILVKVDNEPYLSCFLNNEFMPIYHEVVSNKVKDWGVNQAFDTELEKRYRTLSPSDFGFHNAIKLVDGQIIYIDLEYFGWDDPVKLTSDFLWHAGMKLTEPAKYEWLEGMTKIFSGDLQFNARFKLLHPLYGLRWCMILLNEFLKNKWKIREHADQNKINNEEKIKKIQLVKAKKYLNRVKDLCNV
jgi:hypothetical protein